MPAKSIKTLILSTLGVNSTGGKLNENADLDKVRKEYITKALDTLTTAFAEIEIAKELHWVKDDTREQLIKAAETQTPKEADKIKKEVDKWLQKAGVKQKFNTMVGNDDLSNLLA